MPVSKNWFVYRGKRDYLHSTSLFDYIVTEHAIKAGAPADIDFVFMHKSKNRCYVEEKNCGTKGLVASFQDSHGQYYIYETEEIIEKRVPYNEPRLGEHFYIEKEKCYVNSGGDSNTFIEIAVAAYKEVLVSLFPEYKERYVFARVQLSHIPVLPFEICYKRKIAKRFYEGEISVRGEAVGLIYFGI